MTTYDHFFHLGPWDSATRQIPAVAFVEKYASTVDSLDLSGPFYNFFAPGAKFYNTDGIVYDGGGAIWSWMKRLFGVFSAVHHDIQSIRLIKAGAEEWRPESEAHWVILETTTLFSMKSPTVAGDPIEVRRLLSFLVGKSEVDGQGTDGLQILQAKVWWDSGVLDRELARRKDQR